MKHDPTKPLPSFGRRKGRKLRQTRQEAVDTLLPVLQITPEDAGAWRSGKVGELFPQHSGEPVLNRLALEIGFGSGEHVLAQARAHADTGFIGCEPYINGFGTLLKALKLQPQHNIRLYTDDARLLIDRLPDACLDRVFILFPDPWPKARHHKRRLVQLPFLASLARVMKPGAELRLATDHADYLTWMLEHLLASPHFEWTARGPEDWQNPPADWVRTGYQEWAEKEGRASTYLIFRRK